MTATTVPVTKFDDRYVYVFPPSTLTGLDSVKSGVSTFGLDLCGDISIVLGTRAVNNPFSPANSTIPAGMRGPNDPARGTRIEVLLVRAVLQDLISGKVRATLTIFDAVGDVVVEKIDMKPDATNARLYFIWDGKTRQGMRAAPGTYLARLILDDLVRGRTQQFQTNVGIKK
jgi:hypothetical protein